MLLSGSMLFWKHLTLAHCNIQTAQIAWQLLDKVCDSTAYPM